MCLWLVACLNIVSHNKYLQFVQTKIHTHLNDALHVLFIIDPTPYTFKFIIIRIINGLYIYTSCYMFFSKVYNSSKLKSQLKAWIKEVRHF